MLSAKSYQSDVVVLGGGVAGMAIALKCAAFGQNVLIVGPGLESTCSMKAQGGIIYKSEDLDEKESLTSDIMSAGKWSNRLEAVSQLVNTGPDVVEEILVNLCHAEFSTDEDGRLLLTQEAAHSKRRIIYNGDHTGKNITEAMWNVISENPKIMYISGKAYNILIDFDGNCCGVSVISCNMIYHIYASNVVVCTGGIGGLYKYSTNPPEVAGEGFALCKRAGAKLVQMSNIQFHPTSLYLPSNMKLYVPLLTEALRGEGGYLLDERDDRYMLRYPKRELEARDIVATENFVQCNKSSIGHVWLDVRHLHDGNKEWIKQRFPSIYQNCLDVGIDITSEKVPTVPCQHFIMGGVEVDLNGLTSVPNLYAVGEVSCTGLHGSNRLASTSLLEALVWAVKCSQHIIGKAQSEINTKSINKVQISINNNNSSVTEQIRDIMWNCVGICRNKELLEQGKLQLEIIKQTVDDTFILLRCETAIEIINDALLKF